MAKALIAAKRYGEAVTLLRQAVALQPRPSVFRDLGDAQYADGKPDSAFLSYMQAAALSLVAGDLEEACLSTEESLTVRPSDPDALSIRATLRWMQKDVAGALADFENLLALRPRDATSEWRSPASYCRATGWTRPVCTSISSSSHHPRHADARWLKAEALVALGDKAVMNDDPALADELWTAAQRNCSISLEIQPDNPACERARAVIYCRLQEYDKALQKLSEVVERDPADVRSYGCRAEALLGSGQIEAALSSINMALALETGADTGWLQALKARILARYPDGQGRCRLQLSTWPFPWAAPILAHSPISKSVLRSRKEWSKLAGLSRPCKSTPALPPWQLVTGEWRWSRSVTPTTLKPR